MNRATAARRGLEDGARWRLHIQLEKQIKPAWRSQVLKPIRELRAGHDATPTNLQPESAA
jgi:hypothetical protein